MFALYVLASIGMTAFVVLSCVALIVLGHDLVNAIKRR
jgi:hypothetical protein